MYGQSLRKAERAEVALTHFPYQAHYRTPNTLANYEKAVQDKFYMKGYSGWGQTNQDKPSPLAILVTGAVLFLIIRSIA